MQGKSSTDLPPGFRFHPTDEELIMYYLRNQATSRSCPVSIIQEVDIYKFDPWQLPEKSAFGENEWYFFSPRDRKYPNGARPNRAAVSGYWKATGTDKAIYSGSTLVGVKKALVFYSGRPPKGVKTDWIMHEYRLNESKHHANKANGSMRLDDWVLCRIYKKKHIGNRYLEEKTEDKSTELCAAPTFVGANEQQQQQQQQQKLKFPRNCSLTYLSELDYMGPISQLLNDDDYNNTNLDLQTIMGSTWVETLQHGEYGKLQFSQGGHQPVFVNPMVDEFQ